MLSKKIVLGALLFVSATLIAQASTCTVLTKGLLKGSENSEVLALQQFLFDNGYLTAKPNGYFGNGTVAAVKKFQAKNGLSITGTIGPVGRGKIKEVSCSNTGASSKNEIVPNGIKQEEVFRLSGANMLPLFDNGGPITPNSNKITTRAVFSFDSSSIPLKIERMSDSEYEKRSKEIEQKYKDWESKVKGIKIKSIKVTSKTKDGAPFDVSFEEKGNGSQILYTVMITWNPNKNDFDNLLSQDAINVRKSVDTFDYTKSENYKKNILELVVLFEDNKIQRIPLDTNPRTIFYSIRNESGYGALTEKTGDLYNAQRKRDVETILKVMSKYYLDNNRTLPVGVTSSFKEICKINRGVYDTSECVNLVNLSNLSGKYFITIPVEPQATTTNGVGYRIRETSPGRIEVAASFSDKVPQISAVWISQ